MKKILYIEGMKCENCAKHVREALNDLKGITNTDVNLKEKKAIIEFAHDIDEEMLRKAISEAGYKIISIG